MVDIASLPSCEGSKKEVRDKLGETDDRCQVEGKEGSRRNNKKDTGDGASENKESIGCRVTNNIRNNLRKQRNKKQNFKKNKLSKETISE